MSISAGKTIPDSYQINPVTGKVEQKTLGNKLIAYSLAIGDSQDTSVFNVFEGAIADNQETNQAAESGLKPEVSTAANLDFCQCIQPMILTDEQQEQYALPEPYLSELVRLTKTLVAQLGDRLVLEWLICPATTPKSPEPSNSNSKIFPNATLYLTQVSPLDTTRKKQQLTHRSVARDRLPESTPESTPESSKHHPLLVGLGAAPGEAIAPAFVIRGDNKFIENIPPGSIIVSKTINVDTLFCLQKAAGVIAEQGGITSHAAILARELGIPAVVSAARATEKINPGQRLLINGDRGAIYHLIGQPASEKEPSNARPELNQRHSIFRTDNPETIASKNIEKLTSTFPPIATQLLVNLSQPKSLKKIANLPVDGVGLLRSEMMIIDILDRQPPQQWIEAGRQQEFVDLMSDRLVKIARYMFPRPVFYRSCDLRSDEYQTSEEETNPALGVHGAFSYLVDSSLFELELAVLERVQTDGHNNLHLILPFVRSVEEFIFCRQRVEQAGLNRVSGFQLWIMAEVPSVLFLLEDYIKAGVQGIAIGTNDLTQLLLGADRNHPQFQSIFDPRHPAVRKAICQLISTAKQAGIPCSICGHNPAMYPEVVDDLVRWGITGISVEPISFETTYRAIARSEQRLILEAARRKL